MKVITLDSEKFDSACKELEHRIGDFAPDIVIGIKTGGEFVAERIFTDVEHVYVKLQRSSSKHKNNRIFKAVKQLPLPVLDFMRIVEARLLQLRPPKQAPAFVIPEDTADALKGKRNILIVDDAIDSGTTMKRVRDGVQNIISNKSGIKSAVITVTTKHPIFKPDYSIYNNGTLIRFPWSKDAK